jgi:hypothetical protein
MAIQLSYASECCKFISCAVYKVVILTYFQAGLEYDVLRNVQSIVEQNYVDGKQRHHLPSARNPTFEPGASIFFVVEHSDFVKLTIWEVQNIS